VFSQAKLCCIAASRTGGVESCGRSRGYGINERTAAEAGIRVVTPMVREKGGEYEEDKREEQGRSEEIREE